MTIAIVANTSWNLYNFRLPLVGALKQAGYRVVAIAPPDAYTGYVKEACDDYIPVAMQNRGANPFADLALAWKLFRIYRKIMPSCILHYTIKPNIYGTVAARPLKIPCINTVSGLGTVFLTENLTAKIARLLYRISFRFAEKILFQNRDDLALFLENHLVKKEITAYVPGSGIDTEKYQPAPYSRNTPFTFLMVARLLKDKGTEEFAEAARILKNKDLKIHCILAGTPGDIPLSRIEKWTAEGILSYAGFREDVSELISRADCIILPSYREGLPRTLLEGAAMGKPLVATDVAGCRELVKDGLNGFLCQARNAEDLALKMEKMTELDDAVLARFGAESRKLVEKEYTTGKVIEAYMRIVRETFKNRET